MGGLAWKVWGLLGVNKRIRAGNIKALSTLKMFYWKTFCWHNATYKTVSAE